MINITVNKFLGYNKYLSNSIKLLSGQIGYYSFLIIAFLGIGLSIPAKVTAQAELVEDRFSEFMEPASDLIKFTHNGESKIYFSNESFSGGANQQQLLSYNGEIASPVSGETFDYIYPKFSYQGEFYFVISNHLMKYNGDSVSSVLPEGSSLSNFGEFKAYDDGSGEKIYFNAQGEEGNELYVFDGTTVSRLSNINTTFDDDANIQYLTVYDDGTGPKLYFRAEEDTFEEAVWVYDGSDVSRVEDPDEVGNPRNLNVFDLGNGPKLYLSAYIGDEAELVSYDGENFTKITDINPGEYESSDPAHFTTFDDGNGKKLYFSADDGTNGRELWSFDGSSASMVVNIGENTDGSQPEYLFSYNNSGNPELVFSAATDSTGKEIWKYDGNSAIQIADLDEGENGSFPVSFETLEQQGNSSLFFTTNSPQKLYKYDGTSITELSYQPNNYTPGSGILSNEKIVYNGAIYFAGEDSKNDVNSQLWKFDGTSVSPVKPDSNLFGPTSFTLFDDGSGTKLFFIAEKYEYGRELFQFDGTEVTRITDLNEGQQNGLNYDDLTVFDDGKSKKLYFAGDDGENGTELWSYDGESVSLVADINLGNYASSIPRNFIVYNDGTGKKMYFSASDGNTGGGSGTELWSYDGTNTNLVSDLSNGPTSSYPTEFTVFDDGSREVLYFTADDLSSGGNVLWRLNSEGTEKVDVLPSNFYPSSLVTYNGVNGNKLYFSGYSSDLEAQKLWWFDGDTAQVVTNSSSGTAANSPEDLMVFNNQLYFSAIPAEDEGREPHVFDGESIDNIDLNPGSDGSLSAGPVIFDDGAGEQLYVTATNGESGFELFRIGPNDNPFGIATTIDDKSDFPKKIILQQNFPNPFNPQTNIQFTIPSRLEVSLRVYNVLGQEVATLVNKKEIASGTYTVTFNAKNLASGMYIYRLKTGDNVISKKLTVIK